MKKLILPVLLCLSSAAFAQNGALSALESQKYDKAKEAIDKDIADAKNAGKSKVWLVRGQVYEAIANDANSYKLDSMAAMTAYEAYQKAAEMDASGKDGKAAKAALTEDPKATAKPRLYYGLLNQGISKYTAKNYKDAHTLLKTASIVSPSDTLAPMYAGIAAQLINDNEGTKTGFQKYLDNGGKDPVIFYSLANIYRQEKNNEKAAEILDKGIAANPNSKDLQNEKINMFLQSGNTDEAIKNLSAAVDKDPGNAQNVLNLGILYDNAAAATSDELRKLEGETKKGASTEKLLTDAQDKQKVFQEEVMRLTAAIKKNPKSADLKRQLAQVSQQLEESKKAVAEADQKNAQAKQAAAANTGSEAKVRDLQARLQDQRSKAMSNYNKALQLDGNNYDANYNLGVFHFNEGVEVKRSVDAMDMKTYATEGKPLEAKAAGYFKQALPFFEKAYGIKKEDEAKNNLMQTLNILKQIDKDNAAGYETKLKAFEQ